MEYPNGQYYLHSETYDLIWKSAGGVDPSSTFVVESWTWSDIIGTPNDYLAFLAEAKALGANETRILELAGKAELDEFIPNWKDMLFA